MREISTGSPPEGALNIGEVWKCRNFRPIMCYISEMVEWVYAVRHFTSIGSSFQPCEFIAIVPGACLGEAKMCKKSAKMANFWTYGLNYWETVEDRYMLRCVWQALNPLFISVTFMRLSQGRTQGRPKCVLDSLELAKCLDHPQNGWRQRHTGVTLPIVAIRLVFMQLTCDQFAIAKFLFFSMVKVYFCWNLY